MRVLCPYGTEASLRAQARGMKSYVSVIDHQSAEAKKNLDRSNCVNEMKQHGSKVFQITNHQLWLHKKIVEVIDK